MRLQYHFCVKILSSTKPGTEVKKSTGAVGPNSVFSSLLQMNEVRGFVLRISRGLMHLPDDVIV